MESTFVQMRIDQATQLIRRLERISADSVWAHRSSGYRGSLLRWIDLAEKNLAAGQMLDQAAVKHFDLLMEIGLRMLAGAAHENIRKRGFKR
jgi:hypothetical protein